MSPAPDAPLPADDFEKLLAAEMPRFGLAIPPAAAKGLALYLAELDVWRRQTNLTGDLSSLELVHHALESVLGESLIARGARVIDIGSGGGFPGLPIAIVRRDLHVTLSEPRRKRAAFLRHAVRELGLENTTVLAERVEKVGGQTFDAALSRAVGDLGKILSETRVLENEAPLLAWTTDPEALQKDLHPRFRLDRFLPIPASERRKIAVFRAGDVPRGTSGIMPPP